MSMLYYKQVTGISVLPIYIRSGGDCSDTSMKGVLHMDYIIELIILIVILEIIKNIKK